MISPVSLTQGFGTNSIRGGSILSSRPSHKILFRKPHFLFSANATSISSTTITNSPSTSISKSIPFIGIPPIGIHEALTRKRSRRHEPSSNPSKSLFSKYSLQSEWQRASRAADPSPFLSNLLEEEESGDWEVGPQDEIEILFDVASMDSETSCDLNDVLKRLTENSEISNLSPGIEEAHGNVVHNGTPTHEKLTHEKGTNSFQLTSSSLSSFPTSSSSSSSPPSSFYSSSFSSSPELTSSTTNSSSVSRSSNLWMEKGQHGTLDFFTQLSHMKSVHDAWSLYSLYSHIRPSPFSLCDYEEIVKTLVSLDCSNQNSSQIPSTTQSHVTQILKDLKTSGFQPSPSIYSNVVQCNYNSPHQVFLIYHHLLASKVPLSSDLMTHFLKVILIHQYRVDYISSLFKSMYTYSITPTKDLLLLFAYAFSQTENLTGLKKCHRLMGFYISNWDRSVYNCLIESWSHFGMAPAVERQVREMGMKRISPDRWVSYYHHPLLFFQFDSSSNPPLSF